MNTEKFVPYGDAHSDAIRANPKIGDKPALGNLTEAEQREMQPALDAHYARVNPPKAAPAPTA